MFLKESDMSCLVLLLWLHHCIMSVSGHGRLLEPAGRSSMWRFGFNTPVNYNDNQLFCGGYRNTVVNDGKCGVCGDPFQGPFENEAGGKYATGTIVRYYDITEEFINVTVDISAHHRGQFEFRLCPNNDVNTRVTQECLDQHVLQVEGGDDGGVHFIPAGSGIHHLRPGIPRGLTCSQCVLQWKYTTGNFWGVDKASGDGCIGCGDQELFVNCADIAIGDDTLYKNTKTNSTRSATYVKHDEGSHDHRSHYRGVHHGNVSRTYKSDRPEECNRCYALPTWQHFPDMDNWCDSNCKLGNCPPCRCYCGCPRIKFDNPCVGTGEYDTFDKMAGWCWRECCESECPIDKCACSETVKYPTSSGYKVQKQFFELPSIHLFPGAQIAHHHGDSNENTNSADDDDDDSNNESIGSTSSSESDDSDDDSSASEDQDHGMNSLYDGNINPPGKALTNANILSELVQLHRISLPGVLYPKKHEVSSNRKEMHSSKDSHRGSLNQGQDSVGHTSSGRGSNSDASRLNSFVLSEVRVMKVNKTKSRRKRPVTDSIQPKGNFLSQFRLREVHRTKVNQTTPNAATPSHHLRIGLPQFESFLFGNMANQNKAKHPRYSTKTESTKAPPNAPYIMTESTSLSVSPQAKTSLSEVVSVSKSKPSPSLSATSAASNTLSSVSKSAPDEISLVTKPVSNRHPLITELAFYEGVEANDRPILGGSLTTQRHKTNAGNHHVQLTTITDVSSGTTKHPTPDDPLQKDQVDFIQRMAVDPRLLTSSLDLDPILTNTMEEHHVKTTTATDKHTDRILPEISDIPTVDSTLTTYHSRPTAQPEGTVSKGSTFTVNDYINTTPGDLGTAQSTSMVNDSINKRLSEVKDHTSEGSTFGNAEQDSYVTENFRKDKHTATRLSEDISSTTQTPQIKMVSDSDKLLREVSRNIHEKRMVVDNILNKETEANDNSPQTNSVTYHKLNFVKSEKVNGATSKDAPYVVDARLLNKMLETVQSWINHPMFVVH